MNLFSITSLMIFASSIGFGLSVYASDRKSKVNKRWFIFSGFLAMWGLGIFGVTWSNSVQSAFSWQYILDVSAIFMAVSYFVFASELVKINNRIWQILLYIIGIVFAIFSFTPYFKTGVALRYGFYWIVPGQLYFIFPIFFLLIVVFSLILYIRAYIRSTDYIFRAQIRNIFLASLIGFSGGMTNFLPQITNTYPFGNYFVLLYLFFMSYGVLRYKLLTAKIISAQLFAGATFLVFLFSFLQADTIENKAISLLLLILVGVFSFLLVKGVYREVSQRERIEKLAEDLEGANKHLTELDRQKSEFVSFATHQLRAPLTAMKGYASLILDGDMGELGGQAREGVLRIFDSTNTLVSIVDDYLNVSRIELGTMKYAFDTVDLKQLIEDTIAEIKPNIDASKLAFSFNAETNGRDYRITADRDKLKQVIANIIDNSMKYTPSGSITATLSHDKIAHKFIFKVKDTGIGIAPEVLPRLFQKWSRAQNGTKTNIRGTGLGLYVAKQIVEAHHGILRAESEGEGRGSTFIVEIEPFA
ncbi:MAG: ATP-binding protein, partial [Patescibacteria group bacterium]